MMAEENVAQRAESLVQVRNRQPGGPWFVELVNAPTDPVRLGPYDNPALAKEDGQKIQRYLAALLGEKKKA